MPEPPDTISRREAGALLTAVLVAAVSGITYELLLGTTAAFLVGDSVTGWSATIGVFLAAMGVGSFLTRYVRHDLLPVLVAVEVTVALIGGFSIFGIFAVFAWADTLFRPAFYGAVLLIGTCVGLEVPLLARALRRYGGLRTTLSAVFGVDYGGALIASILYPLVLYPVLGLARTALAASVFNLIGAGLILWAYHRQRGLFRRGVVAVGLAAVTLIAGLVAADWLTGRIDEALYRPEELVYAERSPHQVLALTRSPGGSVQLYLNGHLQFASEDESRYHESLVHVPMAFADEPRRVLVLGGGDGLAVRELLRHPSVESITLVDLDPMVTRLAQHHPMLLELNEDAFADPRVEIVHDDALRWLRTGPPDAFDVVLMDLPDPSTPALSRLYTVQMYRLVARVLHPDGVAAVQAGSPWYASDAYWCIAASLEAAGLYIEPYHVTVPSFGEWGFIAASQRPLAAPSTLRVSVATRFLSDELLASLFLFPPDLRRPEQTPHTLLRPRLTRLFREGWRSRVQ